MGVDKLAVFDPELRVHGIVGLSVADASVIPQIIAGPGTKRVDPHDCRPSLPSGFSAEMHDRETPNREDFSQPKGMTYVGEASRESLHHHRYWREHRP